MTDFENRFVSFCFMLFPFVPLVFSNEKAASVARGRRPKNGGIHWGNTMGERKEKHNWEIQQENETK